MSTESTAPLFEAPSQQASTIYPGINRPAPRAETTPLGEERYRVSFTANKALVAKFERLVGLMSHQIDDLPAALDKAVDIAIEVIERRRFGQQRAGKKSQPPAQKAQTRYIPADIRREVYERDNGKCTFVGSTGRRCSSQHRLQFDHINPRGRRGVNTADNLRVRCQTHNLYTAKLEYGAEFMAQFTASPPAS